MMGHGASGATAPESQDLQPLRVPVRWRKFLQEMMTLDQGQRWQITLTTDPRAFDWSVTDLGKVRKP